MKLDERRRLHQLSVDELTKELLDAQRKLLDYRFDVGLNRLTDSAGMHKTRKLIAILKTLIREKELLAGSGFTTMDEYKVYKHAERKAYHLANKA